MSRLLKNVICLHTAVLGDKLVSFKISNGALTAKDLPTRLKLLDWGVNKTVKGDVTVGAQTLALLAVNQARLGYDRVQIDFNHQTVPGSETYQADPVEVAGYGTPEIVDGDGLYLVDIEWTPAGKKYAANYHDLSPTPKLDKKGEVTFLHSVALCRQGAVKDLTFYNASFLQPKTAKAPSMKKKLDLNAASIVQLLKLAADPAAADDASGTDWRSLLVALLQKLGVSIPDTATDADIGTLVDQFKAPAPATTDDDKKKAAAAAAAKPGAGDVAPMSADAMNKIIDGRFDKIERERLVELATSQGKVIPLSAEEIEATPVSILKNMVAKLTATVPLEARAGGNPAKDGKKFTTLSANQKLICKNTGVTEEKYLERLNAEIGEGQLVTLNATITAPIDMPEREGKFFNLPIDASTKIWAGSGVCIDSSTGFVTYAQDAANLTLLGRAEYSVDNSADGAGGALSVNVKRGVFKFFNSSRSDAEYALAATNLGQLCYVENEQTVQVLAGSLHKVIAGVFLGIDTDGKVWVDTRIALYESAEAAEFTQTQNSLTDSSGGTAAAPSAGVRTIAAVVAATTDTSAAKLTTTQNAISDLAAELNLVKADIAALKALI